VKTCTRPEGREGRYRSVGKCAVARESYFLFFYSFVCTLLDVAFCGGDECICFCLLNYLFVGFVVSDLAFAKQLQSYC
jgi:hypothetical protein